MAFSFIVQTVQPKAAFLCAMIRYDTRCYFNLRSKADVIQLNLPHGTDSWQHAGLINNIVCVLTHYVQLYTVSEKKDPDFCSYNMSKNCPIFYDFVTNINKYLCTALMMMDELTLTWHIVLRLQGHVTVKKESRIVDALVDCTSRDSCMSERKARSSVYHEKLAVMTKPGRTLTDCSKQMRQLPGRHGRQW